MHARRVIGGGVVVRLLALAAVGATLLSWPAASVLLPSASPTGSGAHGLSPSPGITAVARPTSSASRRPIETATPPPSATAVPAFRHVYLIVMENKEYGSIVGSSAAPYLNRLIHEGGLASRYDAIAHPSEPNYLALF